MIRKTLFQWLCSSCVLLSPGTAAATAAAGAGVGALLIKAGRLIDLSTGQVLRDLAILSDGEHIKEVGPPRPSQAMHARAYARSISGQRWCCEACVRCSTI